MTGRVNSLARHMFMARCTGRFSICNSARSSSLLELSLLGHMYDLSKFKSHRMWYNPGIGNLQLEAERSLIEMYLILMFRMTFVTYTHSRSFMQGLAGFGRPGRSGFEFRATQTLVCDGSRVTVPADGFLRSFCSTPRIPIGHEEDVRSCVSPGQYLF